MLGKIRLADLGSLRQLADGELPLPQEVQYLKPLGRGEDAAHLGVELVQVLFHDMPLHSLYALMLAQMANLWPHRALRILEMISILLNPTSSIRERKSAFTNAPPMHRNQ